MTAAGINKIIGHRLRVARVDARLTLAQAAKGAGINKDSISRYERGMYQIPVSTLVSLCTLYGKDPADIIKPQPNQLI